MQSVKLVFLSFLAWRLWIFLVAFISIYLIPQFGARFPYYNESLISTDLPYWVWGFANFDGVHYLTIAQHGYIAQYTQAFFPLYPLLINLFTVGQNYLLTGLFISNLFLFLFLYFTYQLFKLDYNDKISFWSVILILAFPTAFYLGSLYTESLFLFLCALTFYLIRKKRFLLAGLTVSFATASRIFGVILIPVLILEIYLAIKNKEIHKNFNTLIKVIISLLISPLGLIAYMVYLQINFNDPLYFLNAQQIFGERSNFPIILLPQVFYRYLNILLSIPVFSLAFFNAFLELLITVLLLILVIYAYKKVKLSYILFTLGCLILPTLTGTLLSMPRFALTSFLLFPYLVINLQRYIKLIIALSLIIQFILLAIFIRGYWVA